MSDIILVFPIEEMELAALDFKNDFFNNGELTRVFEKQMNAYEEYRIIL